MMDDDGPDYISPFEERFALPIDFNILFPNVVSMLV
jgi:hypothetical protein